MIELTGINEEEAHVTLAPGQVLKASWSEGSGCCCLSLVQSGLQVGVFTVGEAVSAVETSSAGGTGASTNWDTDE